MYTVTVDDPYFAQVLQWLADERAYQLSKWDYGPLDEAHALQGLDDESWTWQRGIENYGGRVRTLGPTSPLGVQAWLKLCSTNVAMIEHLLRGEHIDGLPQAGLPSGETGV